MLFSLQMCAASDPSIPSDLSYWHAPSCGPDQKYSSVSQCKLTAPFSWGEGERVPFAEARPKTKSKNSIARQSFGCSLLTENVGGEKVKGQCCYSVSNHNPFSAWYLLCVCMCPHCIPICVFMWGLCECLRLNVYVWVWVHNAWCCWEEWLLYSCLAGAMGARPGSLGSYMDGLRRSPSFIKCTPTCRIDLAKEQGGNSSSSVFPNHKSFGGTPPQGSGDTIVNAALPSDSGRGRAGDLCLEWPQTVLWNQNRVWSM